MAFSHSGQSGRRFASASERGSNAAASLISAAIAYSSKKLADMIQSAIPSPSSSLVGASSMAGGICTPRATTGSEGRAEVVPRPSIKSRIRWLGFQTRLGGGGSSSLWAPLSEIWATGTGSGTVERGFTMAGAGCEVLAIA
ncbi:hypothetical protein C0991_000263, partial [Blastosporella zonata]